jgi:cell cycle arrest protein BUB3
MPLCPSYTYEHGEQEHPSDAIYVRQIADVEVRPKQRK